LKSRERIQNSIDYIEDHLEEGLTVEKVAKHAYMSLSGFYRMFFAITGYPVKEYVIHWRISQASKALRYEDLKVIDAAVKYSYGSVDAF